MLVMDQARHSDATPERIFRKTADDRKACKHFQKS